MPELLIDTFEYVPADAGAALLRLTGRLLSADGEPVELRALVMNDRRLTAVPMPGETGPLSPRWRAAFAAPIDAVRDSGTAFMLELGDDGTVALPPPREAPRQNGGPERGGNGRPRVSRRRLIAGAAGALGAATAGLAVSRGGHSAPATGGGDHRHAAGMLAPAAVADASAARGVAFEAYRRPDPTLPAPPAGPVKRFRVDVFEHVTKVAANLAPIRVWSFGVNGRFLRGTGASPPMVLTEGDQVEIDFVNGGSRSARVLHAHSPDFHAAEVAPNVEFRDLPPGRSRRFRFTAAHPGVFLYHCATAPMLLHLGAGMVGMMVVKPRDLPPADRELWVVQQEYFPGRPGEDPDMAKMEARQPDVVAFNGYANQYRKRPIRVRSGERLRIYFLNAGPTQWSAFHVIGAAFDRTVVEGQAGHDSQTLNLAPSQGGWVDLTLERPGAYALVTHAFADMMRGADGALVTEGVPASEALTF